MSCLYCVPYKQNGRPSTMPKTVWYICFILRSVDLSVTLKLSGTNVCRVCVVMFSDSVGTVVLSDMIWEVDVNSRD